MVKTVDCFTVQPTKKRGYSYSCKECHKKYVREVWYVKNSDKQKSSSKNWKQNNKIKVTANRYKVPVSTIESAINNFTGSCPICLRETTNPHLDHDHVTGVIRGYICPDCNFALGFTDDNVNTLLRMIGYINKHTPIVQRIE